MKWDQIVKAWENLVAEQPEFRVVGEKVNWLEIRLHNVPHYHDEGYVYELPEEAFNFWPEKQVEVRRSILSMMGVTGLRDSFGGWGSEDMWVGPPRTASMLARLEATGSGLLVAWVSAVLRDSKGEREVEYDLKRETLKAIDPKYDPWGYNTKHMLKDIEPFGVDFNLEHGKSTCPVRTLPDLLRWVAKNAIHNQSVYRAVRLSATYDEGFHALTYLEQRRIAQRQLEQANTRA